MRIEGLAEFIATVVEHCPNHQWTFRGQTEDFELLPKAYRCTFHIPNNKDNNNIDLIRFQRWCDQAIAFESDFPQHYIEQLALAQHYGLATRLLDWTANAAVALYFATELGNEKEDGAVYLYRKPERSQASMNEFKSLADLGNCNDVLFYRPRLVTRRILAQDGEFTIHPYKKPLESNDFEPKIVSSLAPGGVVKMVIPGCVKGHLQYQLRAIGIQARTIFPDLEGLAKSTNWQTRWMVDKLRNTADC